jgi:hypothetical protein
MLLWRLHGIEDNKAECKDCWVHTISSHLCIKALLSSKVSRAPTRQQALLVGNQLRWAGAA